MADREEIADKLRKRFPELPEREIEITLEQCNYDLDRAIKALEEKFYGEEAAIPATTSLWSSLVAPLTGEDQAPGGSGASDWSSSLRSLALGVEQLMSGVEEVVSTVGDTLAAVVEDVGDLVFGEEAGEEDYANGAADASGSKKKDEVVVAGGRSQRVKKRLSGTIPGGDGVTLGVGTLSAVAAHSDDEDDEDWNDKLD